MVSTLPSDKIGLEVVCRETYSVQLYYEATARCGLGRLGSSVRKRVAPCLSSWVARRCIVYVAALSTVLARPTAHDPRELRWRWLLGALLTRMAVRAKLEDRYPYF